MAELQNFRSAFNGFNREDVVNYITYLTNQHEYNLNQLYTELDELRRERDELQARVREAADQQTQNRNWQEELDQLRQENAALQQLVEEQELTAAQLRSELENSPELEELRQETNRRDEELLAYRRAESAERRALSRVNQMYDRASGVLGDVNALMDETSNRIVTLAQRLNADLTELQAAISDSENTMTTASSMISALRPEMEEG